MRAPHRSAPHLTAFLALAMAVACDDGGNMESQAMAGSTTIGGPVAGTGLVAGGTGGSMNPITSGPTPAGSAGTAMAAAGAMAPPTGGTMSPPTGGTMAPPTGATMAPPTGGTVAPPTGGTMSPPTGGTMTSPTGGTMVGGAGGGGSTAMGSMGCGNTSFPEDGMKTIEVDGMTRDYAVELPEGYDPNRPYSVVFAWHGLGGTAAMTARTWYGLGAQTDDSAIFIAGQALPSAQQSGFAAWAIRDDQDINYTQALLDWASESYCIDSERVFSIGMSNGGMMSNIVACEMGDTFRAMVAVAGGGPEGYARMPCKGQLAALIIHGNTDNNVPFSYGVASRDYWLDANGCSTDTTSMPNNCLAYEGCDDGFPVVFCEHDGGHMVPSYTGEVAWTFFAQF